MRHHILYLLEVSPEEYLAFVQAEPVLARSRCEVLFRGGRWLAVTTDDLERPGELLARKFGVPVFEFGVLENGVRWYVFHRGEGEVDRYSSDPSTYAPGGPAPPSTFRGDPSAYADLLVEGVGVSDVRHLLEMQRVAGREFLIRFGRLLGLPDPLASSGRMGTRPLSRAVRAPLEPGPDLDVRRLFEEWERSERASGRLARSIDVGRGVRLVPAERGRGTDSAWFLVDRGGRSVRSFEHWDLRAGTLLAEVPLSILPPGASRLAIDPSGRFLSGVVLGRSEGRVFVFDLEERRVAREGFLPSSRHEVLATAVDPSGRYVAASSRRSTAFVDLESGEVVHEVRPPGGWSLGAAFLPGSRSAVHWAEGRVGLVALDDFGTVDTFELGNRPEREAVHDLLAVPGAPYLVVAGRRGVRVRDVEKSESVHHLHRPDDAARREYVSTHLGHLPRPLRRAGGLWVGLGDDEVLSIDYHHWRNLLATGNADGYVRVWNLESLELAAEFWDLEGPIRMVKFSQDGEFLWTEGCRGIVRAWSWEA